MRLIIQFTRPKRWFAPLSWLIQLIDKTRYSHVRLVIITRTGRQLHYEAGGTQVNFRGRLWSAQHPVYVINQFNLVLTPTEYEQVIDKCIEYAGLKYGVTQLLGIGIAKCLGLHTNPFTNGPHQQVCSELVLRILEELGRIPRGLLSADLVTPRQLNEELQRRIPLV